MKRGDIVIANGGRRYEYLNEANTGYIAVFDSNVCCHHALAVADIEAVQESLPYTFRSARKCLSLIGMTIRHDSAYGEYRVNMRGGAEESAYYTSDLQDAVETGINMARRAYIG